MFEFLLSVLSSIIGNLLTPTFKNKIGLKDYQPPEIPRSPLPEEEDEESLKIRRQYVKEQWAIYGWNFFVLFLLFLYVAGALVAPIAFKTNFFSQALECGTTRISILCKGSYWPIESVQILLFLFIIFWAFLIWFLAQFLAIPIAKHIHINHRPVDYIYFRRIHGLTIALLAFLLAGHWIYLLFPTVAYGWAVALPFIILFAIWFMSSGR